jgi:hypothetical protein
LLECTKYVDGKVVTRKFVPLEKLKKIAKTAPAAKSGTQKQKIVYKKVPENIANTSKPVIVQDDTSFGQYVKRGAGTTLGSLAVEKMFEGIGSLFSDD